MHFSLLQPPSLPLSLPPSPDFKVFYVFLIIALLFLPLVYPEHFFPCLSYIFSIMLFILMLKA